MTDSPSVTCPSPAMTTLLSRRTQRTVVERIRRGARVFFFMSAIFYYTAPPRVGRAFLPALSTPFNPEPLIFRSERGGADSAGSSCVLLHECNFLLYSPSPCGAGIPARPFNSLQPRATHI